MGTPLQVEVSVLDKLSANVAKMNASVTGFVNNTERGIKGLTQGFVALAAFGGVAAGLGALVSRSLELAGSIQKTSAAYGLSTRAVQEWNYVAKQSESSAEAIHKAFGTFAKNAVDAARGTGTAKDAFKSLGIQLTDSNGNMKESNELFKDAMLRVADIKDPMVRAAEAQRIFGKAGKDLLPVLSQGSEEIRKLIGAASDLGQILDERTLESLDSAGDKMDTFKTATAVLGAELTNTFVPALGDAALALSRFLAKISGSDLKSSEEKLSETVAAYTQESVDLKKAIDFAVESKSGTVAVEKYGQFLSLTLEDAKARLKSLEVSLAALNDDFLGKKKGGAPGGGGEQGDPDGKVRAQVAAKAEQAYRDHQARLQQASDNTVFHLDKSKRDSTERQKRMDDEIAERIKKNGEKGREEVKKFDKEREKSIEREKELRKDLAADQIQGAGRVFSAFANANKRNAQERKNIARFEAFINTAVGVTRAIPNIPLMIFAGLEGAAQQVAIANARFANGVRGAAPGWATVGEQGPENIFVPAGASIYTSTETRNMTTNNTPSIHFNITDKSGNISNMIFDEMRAGGSADRMVTAMFDMARKKGLVP